MNNNNPVMEIMNDVTRTEHSNSLLFKKMITDLQSVNAYETDYDGFDYPINLLHNFHCFWAHLRYKFCHNCGIDEKMTKFLVPGENNWQRFDAIDQLYVKTGGKQYKMPFKPIAVIKNDNSVAINENKENMDNINYNCDEKDGGDYDTITTGIHAIVKKIYDTEKTSCFHEYEMDDPLVVIICVSKYQYLENLPSTKVDMKLMSDLWGNKYSFTIVTNELDDVNGEYHVTKEDFDILLDETRLRLRKNKKKV